MTIDNCAVYDSVVGLRIESRPENLKIKRVGIGRGIERKLRFAGSGSASDYKNIDLYTPPPLESVRKNGLSHRAGMCDGE